MFGDFLGQLLGTGGFFFAVLSLGAGLKHLWERFDGGDDMNAQRVRQSAWATLIDAAKAIGTLTAAATIITGALWFFVKDQAADAARTLVGTDEIIGEVTEQRVLIMDLGENVARLDRRVNSLEPSPAVAVFDPLRSVIDSRCLRGEVCEWSYFVRRANNVYGNTCDAPEAQRVFADAAGVEHFPARGSTSNPRRLSTTATRVDGSFVVPERAALGPGEFFLRNTYTGCGEGRNETITIETMRLVTTIETE